MKTTIPEKLKKGNEIRIVSPSRSLSIISEENIKLAEQRINNMGFAVTYGKNSKIVDEFDSSSIDQRVEDLHAAFLDSNVKAILTSIGGFSSNQILRNLDYEIIKSNPKIFCGYSDITAIQNAILSKTGLVTYSGPHFSTFAIQKGFEYTQSMFEKCLLRSSPYLLEESKQWSDDLWFLDQKNRNFIPNHGFGTVNEGCAKGHIVGGNISTLNLLQGTEYMPSLKNSVLFLEEDNIVGDLTPMEFDRDLQSIIHLPDFKEVKAVVIGRFKKACKMNNQVLEKILRSKKELKEKPIVYNADFSHTDPIATFPIGGTASVEVSQNKCSISIIKH